MFYKQSRSRGENSKTALRRFMSVDPARLALASSGANADMLLHTLQARIHKNIITQKEPIFQWIPFVAPNFSLWRIDHISVVIL